MGWRWRKIATYRQMVECMSKTEEPLKHTFLGVSDRNLLWLCRKELRGRDKRDLNGYEMSRNRKGWEKTEKKNMRQIYGESGRKQSQEARDAEKVSK